MRLTGAKCVTKSGLIGFSLRVLRDIIGPICHYCDRLSAKFIANLMIHCEFSDLCRLFSIPLGTLFMAGSRVGTAYLSARFAAVGVAGQVGVLA